MLLTIYKKYIRTAGRLFIACFILMNIVAAFHAYKFTHFTEKNIEKTKDAKKLSSMEKFSILLFGIDNPRPINKQMPEVPYETIRLKSNREIECWYMKAGQSEGTVILFHGYTGNKSSMLDKAYVFLSLHYDVLLVDFMGSGGSEGSQTTLGYFEADEVKTCYDYILKSGVKNICLFGTSMGAVAIMKAINDYRIAPSKVILECPFGSMYQTVCARFRSMHAPVFPMAGLLVFWGGLENRFWAFGHNPVDYASSITSPVLLIYGSRDEKVSWQETFSIYSNITSKKKLLIFPDAGHENFLKNHRIAWKSGVDAFLLSNN
jgi:pimeloyl-ACP methyl ester carboxylesterase